MVLLPSGPGFDSQHFQDFFEEYLTCEILLLLGYNYSAAEYSGHGLENTNQTYLSQECVNLVKQKNFCYLVVFLLFWLKRLFRSQSSFCS